MYTFRARFAKDIVAEFLPPFLGSGRHASRRAILFLDGVPSVPNKKALLRYWSKKGYWVFHPRFRGTWESGGVFLQDDPTNDVRDVVSGLGDPLISEWDGAVFHPEIKDIFIIGGSFSGPTALFASHDDRVKKVVVISPVVDWRALSGEESIEEFPHMVMRAFGNGYRSTSEYWKKLQTGDFHNPMLHAGSFDGKKVMIIHAQDDRIVFPSEVILFAQQTGSTFTLLKRGGHLGAQLTMSWLWSRRVEKFFTQP